MARSLDLSRLLLTFRQVLVHLIWLGLLGCRSASTGGEVGGADASSRTAPPRVVIESPSGRSSAVRVEVVRTPEALQRGLMFREKLGQDEGMLFVFPATAEHTFWMKDTLIPLDMIFIGEDRSVVGMVLRAEPLTLTPRSCGARSRYVLEVNAGWVLTRGIKTGDRVRFEGMPDRS